VDESEGAKTIKCWPRLCVGKEYHALVRLLCVGELLYVMDCSYALKVVAMRWRQLCVDYYCRRGGSIR